jgi:N-acyl-D-amino-acid deacylase
VSQVVIRSGTVVDGTGAAGRQADVLLADGRITAVIDPGAAVPADAQVLDAAGCIVTPGFIDPHTHFDAQLWWDGAATPSAYHGVTSVVIGNCGFGVAPVPGGDEEYVLRSLEAVEEIPYASTRAGVRFRWSTWPEYFAALGSLALGVNVGGYVPHSLLRAAAAQGPADGLVEREEAMLAAALEAGAVGLSSSRGRNHLDANGQPMPSRLADDAEFARLVGVVGDRVWQINVEAKGAGDASGAAALTAEVDRYVAMTRPGGRLSWTPFVVQPGDDTAWRMILEHNHRVNASGAVAPQVSVQPMAGAIIFTGPSTAGMIEGWAHAWAGYAGLTPAEKLARLADESFRAILRTAPADCRRMMAPCYDRWAVSVSPSRPAASGLTLTQLGELDGKHPVDAMLDLALSDDLETRVTVPFVNVDEPAVLELVADPTTLVGLGDAGAHVNSITNFTYPTYLLASIVRDSGRIPLAAAVRELTTRPAEVLGIADRGALRAGYRADVCIIDLSRLAVGEVTVRTDLPAGASRLVQGATGYRTVLVNGEVVLRDDELTGTRPGELIRV